MTEEHRSDAEGVIVHATWAEDEDPSSAVVDAVATATDRDLLETRPLYDYVEADALDSLLVAARADGRFVAVTFDYDGVEIVVDSDGTIEVSLTTAEGG